MSATAPGTLPEPQVRAMFDRIAGVYDRMNAVMTAGLHHRWRARAADLAAVRPGDRVLDVATGTGDLALELARRVAPGGAVVAADFSEGMLELAGAKLQAARERARSHRTSRSASNPPTRSRCPTQMASSPPRPSASARATSRTFSAGWPRWHASSRPAGAWSSWR